MTWNVLCAQGMVASGPTMVTRYPIPRIGITIIRACKLDSLILNRMKKRKNVTSRIYIHNLSLRQPHASQMN